MPDNPIAGLYPQPPQPQQNSILGGNPLGALMQINALKAFQAKQAVGNAFQQNVGPDGTVNLGGVSSAIAASPAAAYAAPEAYGDILTQRGQQISNATSQFGLSAAQNGAVLNAISGLDRPGVSADDIRNTVVNLARSTGIPSSVFTGWLAGIDPSNPRASVQNIKNIALGATANRVATVDPATGQPVTIPQPQANMTSGLPTALPPGQEGALAANQGAFVQDQQRSATTLANVRQLQQALPLIQQLGNSNFGPGSPEFAQAKGALTTLGLIDPNTSDLQVRQEVGKYLLKYARGAADAGRSDHALSAAIGSNPNLDLTQPANLSLIKNQIGMDRMDAAAPVAFAAQNPNPNDRAGYLSYKSNYYQNNDPRAFSFDLMTPQERRQVIDSLGPQNSPAFRKFAQSYQLAKQAGMIQPENQNGQ